MTKQAHRRIGVYWYIFPTFTEGRDTVFRDPSMIPNTIPQDLISKFHESMGVIYLKCGSIIQLKGADDPKTLRGPNPVGVVLDEFATMKVEAWQVIEPVLRINGGWCWFIGTPKGQNHLYSFYQRGQSGHSEWKSWLLKASESGIVSAESLKEAKETAVSEAFYTQEYECAFLEGEGKIFRGVRDVCIAEPEKPQQGEHYVMGVDLAKHVDWTVVTVYKRSNNQQVYQDRFQRLDWPFQKVKIKSVSDMYNKALIVLDATGIGDPIYDDLAMAGAPIEPVKITEPIKAQLVQKLSTFIEQRRIKMIPMQETLFEFDNFSYTIGPTGKFRYGAPDGFHDDIVISHALAIHGLNPLIYKIAEPPKTLIQQAFESAKMRHQLENETNSREWTDGHEY